MHDQATYDPQPSFPSPAPGSEPRGRSRLMLAVALGAVALLLLVGVAALMVGSRQSTSTAQAETLAASSKAAQSAAGTGQATGQVTPVGDEPAPTDVTPTTANTGGNRGNDGKGAPAPAPAPKPTTPAGPSPVITSFTTPDTIDCHNGNFQTFSAEWTTTNAVKTTIAIDGPGIYKTYPANGSDSLPFNCSSPHTFKLTAIGQDGKTVTKTITLQPRNVQVPTTDDGDQPTPAGPSGTIPASIPAQP